MIIRVVKDNISLDELKTMAEENFSDFVKAVVDIDEAIIAVGGEFHSDAEAVMLDHGSKQSSLWGVNLFPNVDPEQMIEFVSLINIRPRDNNRSNVIESDEVRNKIKDIISKIVV